MAIRSFNPNLLPHAIQAGVVGVLVNQFTQSSLKGGLMFGVCGELSSLVARYALSFFTNNTAASRTAERAGRLLGGYYLGNLALQAAGCATLAFAPSTVLISLFGAFTIPIAIAVINDLRSSIFGAPTQNPVST